tara:strand:+ start:2999 stop:3154 length:156 start_codon:yes stop_codon:yes gene_type:complete
MDEIILDDIDLENNIVSKNNSKEWDKCCFYTGISAVVLVVGTVIVVIINQS